MVRTVVLYEAPTTVVDTAEVAAWLRERIDSNVIVRGRFLAEVPVEEMAEAFAEARVLSPYDQDTGNTMLGIRKYEERALTNPDRAGGVLYDGLAIQRSLNRRLPPDERSLETLHVILLDRVLATWGEHDGRWHKRINVLGQPALLSVPGVYEAPAKPEAYYQEQQKHALLAGDTPPREVLEERVEGEFLVEDDPRTTDVVKGYVLQAAHFIETGEAFCDDPDCRLANPHRHPGVIQAQLTDPEFCPDHATRYTT